MHSTNKRTPRLLVLAFTFLVVSTLGVVLFARSGYTNAALAPLEGSTKTAVLDSVSPGGTVDYQIVLRNESASVTTGAIVVTDTLDADLTYVSQSVMVEPETAGVGFPITGGVKFNVNAMSPSDVVTLSFSVVVDSAVPAGTMITNTAEIAYDGNLHTPYAEITVEAPPESNIVSPWDLQSVKAGDSVTISGRAVTASQSPEHPDTPVLDPIVYNAGMDNYYVQWTSVADTLTYVLQESTTADFSNITFEDPNLTGLFIQRVGMSPGSYYYRLKARNISGDSYWSNVESVTVVSASNALPNLAEPDLAPASLAASSYEPTVEVRTYKVGTTPGAWVEVANVTDNALWDWWDWSYNWDVPDDVGSQYVIQTRALDLAGSPGPVDEVTVTVISGETILYMPFVMKGYPPMPTLAVTADDTEGNFTLAWTIPSSDWGVVKYRLQESESADFAVLTLDESLASTSRVFSSHDYGTFYYRVAGANSVDEIAAWSNVVSVEVTGNDYFDDFSDKTSGWPIQTYKRGTNPDGDFFSVMYENGTYNAKILLDYNSFNNKWMGIVKAPFTNEYTNYTVQVNHYFSKAEDQASPPSLGKAGLIFAGNADMTVFYQVEWNYEGNCAVAKYWNVSVPGAVWDPNSISMAKTWGPCQNVLKVGYDQVNTAKVVIGGNVATIYINGNQIHQMISDDFLTFNTVGLTTGAFERTPVESRFDNYTVTGN